MARDRYTIKDARSAVQRLCEALGVPYINSEGRPVAGEWFVKEQGAGWLVIGMYVNPGGGYRAMFSSETLRARELCEKIEFALWVLEEFQARQKNDAE